MNENLEPWATGPALVGGLVVGHDGSAGADAALDWALEDAARRGTCVHVVRTWMLASAIDDVAVAPGIVPSMQECSDATLRLLGEDVDVRLRAWRAGGGADVPVTTHAVHGPSGPTLVTVSAATDLLVVGHRGRGHLADLLLGSVAEYVLRHAACSVVVVRTKTAGARGR